MDKREGRIDKCNRRNSQRGRKKRLRSGRDELARVQELLTDGTVLRFVVGRRFAMAALDRSGRHLRRIMREMHMGLDDVGLQRKDRKRQQNECPAPAREGGRRAHACHSCPGHSDAGVLKTVTGYYPKLVGVVTSLCREGPEW